MTDADSTPFLKKSRGTTAKHLKFVVPVPVRVVLIGRLPLDLTLHKAITVLAVRSGLCGRPCRWSSTPNPRTMTIVVKPRKTGRAKCVGAGLMVPLRNTGQYRIVKNIQVVNVTLHLRCTAAC